MKAMHFSTFKPLVFESVPELHFFTLGRKNAILQVRFFSDANNIHNVQNVFSPSRHLLFLYVLNVVSENPLKDLHLIPAVTTLTPFISNPLMYKLTHIFRHFVFAISACMQKSRM